MHSKPEDFIQPAAPHFAQRAKERGIEKSNLNDLYRGLAWARMNGVEKYAEHVKTVKGFEFWRFSCLDGIFYTVFECGKIYPITIYTQEMYRSRRWADKRRRKGLAKGTRHERQ